jgi:glycosyltransferase involved in cell wall biosynthesis
MSVFKPSYSLVIPCYNEGAGLPALIARCREMLLQRNDLEVVFVNNGSVDHSSAIFTGEIKVSDGPRMWVCDLAENKGYGYGVLAGLRAAKGHVIGWTHADMQSDPADFLTAIKIYEQNGCTPIFVKGSRQKRSWRDMFFTRGMTLFEYVLLGCWLEEINAQPNLFQRAFFESLDSPPNDFSLDLYFFFSAVQRGATVLRFPVNFGSRQHGVGHNDTLRSKLRYCWSTIKYSTKLKATMVASGQSADLQKRQSGEN